MNQVFFPGPGSLNHVPSRCFPAFLIRFLEIKDISRCRYHLDERPWSLGKLPTIFNIIRWLAWVDGTNDSSSKRLMFQALFFFIISYRLKDRFCIQFFRPRMRPRTYLQCFALDSHCSKAKHCRNVLGCVLGQKLDTKPLLEYVQAVLAAVFFVIILSCCGHSEQNNLCVIQWPC